MLGTVEQKKFDLLDRTFKFSVNIRNLVRELKVTIITADDIKQVLRSSGSVGANYIEACEALSKKDFGHRLKIVRKEAKETVYWLLLIKPFYEEKQTDFNHLIDEAEQLTKIFGSIVSKIN